VTAGQAAGVEVVGVAPPLRAAALTEAGATRVVDSLTALLDPRVTAMV
jgi:phosphoglycolate phosphatase-like HAD superfamily hydrolase